MVICIASGKGGTGKTTIATNLAVSLDGSVQLLDCDVEEPNAHLFMRPEFNRTETVTTPVPEVDLTRCDFCGKCGEICQFSAIAVIGKKVLTFPELCHSCKGCMMVCPRDAISEKGRELGILERGRCGPVEFIHGRLRVGEAMSPPLINRVKEYVDQEDLLISYEFSSLERRG
jgi:MinD superfamily P-loop ATPase containing an inserted ferredoxin domain